MLRSWNLLNIKQTVAVLTSYQEGVLKSTAIVDKVFLHEGVVRKLGYYIV